MASKTTSKTISIAISGVFLALSMVLLFVASIIPGIRLTVLTIAAFFIILIKKETNTAGGFIFYVASSLLSLLIVPGKTAILIYVTLLGPCAAFKPIGEKIKNPVMSWVVKLIFFNALFALTFFLFKEALFAAVAISEYGNVLIFAIANIGFIVYDFMLTLVSGIYEKKRKTIR